VAVVFNRNFLFFLMLLRVAASGVTPAVATFAGSEGEDDDELELDGGFNLESTVVGANPPPTQSVGANPH
jgi:hypothetical protein